MRRYKLQKSTFYKMKREYKMDVQRSRYGFNVQNLNDFLSIEEQHWIRDFVKPPKYPLNINLISDWLRNQFGVLHKKRVIKSYLKNVLNYSFKKRKSFYS